MGKRRLCERFIGGYKYSALRQCGCQIETIVNRLIQFERYRLCGCDE